MKNVTISLVLMGLLLGTLCAASDDAYRTDYNSLRTRFHDYMSLRKEADLEKMYEFVSPEVRKTLSFEKYKKKPKGDTKTLIAYNIKAIDLQNNEAFVFFNVFNQSSGVPSPQIKSTGQQRWVLIDNVWYLDLEYSLAKLDFRACGGDEAEQDKSPPVDYPACGSKSRRARVGCGR